MFSVQIIKKMNKPNRVASIVLLQLIAFFLISLAYFITP